MEIPESKIREFILAGHPPKTAIAMAIAKSRKPETEPGSEAAEEPILADALLSESKAEPIEAVPSGVERVLATSGISEAAKAAILARKQSRNFKQSS